MTHAYFISNSISISHAYFILVILSIYHLDILLVILSISHAYLERDSICIHMYLIISICIYTCTYFHVLREREKIVSRETFYVLSHAYLEIYTYALISMC